MRLQPNFMCRLCNVRRSAQRPLTVSAKVAGDRPNLTVTEMSTICQQHCAADFVSLLEGDGP